MKIRTRIVSSFLALLMAATPVYCASAEESLAPAAPAHPSTHDDRVAFARNFATTVLAILHNKEKSYADRKNTLRRSFVASLDIDWMAKFVIGKYWRVATPEQREEYSGLYQKYLTELYVKNFAENPNKGIYAINVLGVKDSVDDEFTVNSTMTLTNKQTMHVDYLVKQEGTKYKVIDIVIENVSLIHSHRAEFTELAAQEGVDGVNHHLKDLLDQTASGTSISMK